MESNNQASPQKYVFITGAAAGIGRATALLFAKRGWFVGIAGRDARKLETLQKEIGEDRCSWHVIDVTDPASVASALEAFSAISNQRLDVLVNNAGLLKAGHFEDISLDDHHQIVETNFKGVLNCSHAAFPLLKNTPGARVINMSSASAMYGAPSLSSYSASKFAVRALTEALNVEWDRHDITVSDVMPPFVDTGMLHQTARGKIKAISYLGVNLTPKDVAKRVWHTAHANELHVQVGLPFRLMALGQKHAPGRLQKRMVKFLSGY